MHRWRRHALLLLAGFLFASTTQAATFRAPSLTDALKALGGYTVPEEWAGVWSSVDSTYSCTPRILLDTGTVLDTVCAGQSLEPDTTAGYTYNCTGTVTATQVNLTCTGSFTDEGCTVTFQTTLVGTRTGDTTISTMTLTTTYTPTLCFFVPDSCREIVSRTTRIGPPPVTCSTPTLRSTWGDIKVRYR